MRPTPLIIGLCLIVAAGLWFVLANGGPTPVTYAPPPDAVLPAQPMGPLPPLTTTQATLLENASNDWTFDATAGDSITVQLIAPSGTLAILAPGEMFPLVQVSVDPANSTATICAQPLGQTGQYTLQVAGVDAPGFYSLRVDHLGPPTAAPLPVETENIVAENSTVTALRFAPCQGQ